MARIEWHLGHVVQALRDQKGWTQPQLAKKAGVDKATVVSVEQMDRNHGRATYEKIATAFTLTIGDLFSLIPLPTMTPREQETQPSRTDPSFRRKP